MYTNSQVTDKVIAGFQHRKAAFIVSNRAPLIAEGIMNGLGRGVTFLHGQGGFTHTERNVIFAVINLTQVSKLKLITHAIDPSAFVIIVSANEVMGRGFNKMNNDSRADLKKALKQAGISRADMIRKEGTNG